MVRAGLSPGRLRGLLCPDGLRAHRTGNSSLSFITCLRRHPGDSEVQTHWETQITGDRGGGESHPLRSQVQWRVGHPPGGCHALRRSTSRSVMGAGTFPILFASVSSRPGTAHQMCPQWTSQHPQLQSKSRRKESWTRGKSCGIFRRGRGAGIRPCLLLALDSRALSGPFRPPPGERGNSGRWHKTLLERSREGQWEHVRQPWETRLLGNWLGWLRGDSHPRLCQRGCCHFLADSRVQDLEGVPKAA